MGSLNIFYANVRSLRQNFDKVKLFLCHSTISYDIIVLTESWINESEFKLYNVPNFTGIIQMRHNRRSGGVVVFIRNGLNYSYNTYFDRNHESILLFLTVDGKKLNLLCTYRNYKSPISTYLHFIEGIKSTVDLIIGDINQDILVLKDESIHYVNFMDSAGLMAQVEFPTRVTANSKTCIDHCYSKSHVGNVEASPLDIGISDHLCLSIQLHGYQVEFKDRSYTFCDLRLVKTQLSNADWTELLGSSDVNLIYKEISDKIKQARSDATETLKINGRNRRRNEWINQQLIDKCRRKNLLYQLHRKYPFCEYISNELKLIQCELKKEIRMAKTNYYDDKFKNANSSKEYWKITNAIIKGGASNKLNFSPSKIVDGTGTIYDVSEKGTEVANLFNDYFANVAENLILESGMNTTDYPPIASVNHSMYSPPLKLEEVGKAIDAMKTKKSSGFDEISSELIKYCKEELIRPFHHLCYVSLEQGIFPDALKLSTVIPLHKDGDKDKVENYRPLYLNSTVGKVIEIIVQRRIMNYLDHVEFLASNQFAYRAKYGTEKALFKYLTEILVGLDKGNKVAAGHVDLRKCFDVINRCLLIKIIEAAGIGGKMLQWLKSYLSNRKQITKLHNKYVSNELIFKYGILQGSGLAPLFFLLFINELCKLKLRNCYFLSFADDCALVCNNSDINALSLDLMTALQKVMQWIINHKLIPNWSKTNIIEYTFNYRGSCSISSSGHVTCHLYDCNQDNQCTCPVINIVKSIKYLGLHIDNHLAWDQHIDYLYKKLRPFNLLLYNLRKFMSTSSMIPIYYAFYQSIMQYGINFWGGAGISKTNKLVTTQKFAVRMLNKSRYNEHTSNIFRELQILPLSILYKKNLLSFVVNNLGDFEVSRILSNIATRQTGRGFLTVPNFRLTNSRKSANYKGLCFFNEMIRAGLDENVTLSTVKKYIKSLLCTYGT